jgi:hypothetical protein
VPKTSLKRPKVLGDEKREIFVRALAVRPDQKRQRKPHFRTVVEEKWPTTALIFDTETRITPDQSLTFGVYRICNLVAGRYVVVEEGLFHDDKLPTKELKKLEHYTDHSVSDVPCFPPRFPLYSRSDFMKRVFWPSIKYKGALVVGFNLPFDITRLALDWSRGEKDEWSLVMSRYPNGVENRNRPRITIQPIDSKKAFIKIARPWNPNPHYS